MSKKYRDGKKHLGVQTRHKWRGVHMNDGAVSLDVLREEVGGLA